MLQKMHRIAALSFCSMALATYSMAVTATPAHAIGPATFFVGLCKTMANMAMEPVEILLLPYELVKEDKTPSATTAPSKSSAPTTTTTTTTTTK